MENNYLLGGSIFSRVSKYVVDFYVTAKEVEPEAVYMEEEQEIQYNEVNTGKIQEHIVFKKVLNHPLLTVNGATIIDLLSRHVLRDVRIDEYDMTGDFKVKDIHSKELPDGSIEMNLCLYEVDKKNTNHFKQLPSLRVKCKEYDKKIKFNTALGLKEAMEDKARHMQMLNEKKDEVVSVASFTENKKPRSIFKNKKLGLSRLASIISN